MLKLSERALGDLFEYNRFRRLALYANFLCDWLETEHEAVSLMEMHNVMPERWEVDYSDPLGSLARRGINDHLVKLCSDSMKVAVEEVVRVARDYQIDGGIIAARVGCKHGCAMIRGVRDGLKEKTRYSFISPRL